MMFPFFFSIGAFKLRYQHYFTRGISRKENGFFNVQEDTSVKRMYNRNTESFVGRKSVRPEQKDEEDNKEGSFTDQDILGDKTVSIHQQRIKQIVDKAKMMEESHFVRLEDEYTQSLSAKQYGHPTEFSFTAYEASRHLEKCLKNPGHKTFIPVTNFSIHLPEDLRGAKIVEFVRVNILLTVKITVCAVSSARSKIRLGSTVTDTGYVEYVSEAPSVVGCDCEECKTLGGPPRDGWRLLITTANHAVFDEFEVLQTRVDFFYGDCFEVKTLRGKRLLGFNLAFDRCAFECITHDKELGETLSRVLKRNHDLCLHMKNKVWQNNQDIAVIVSHPHGRPKMVTVGRVEEWSREVERMPHLGQVRYTADTCPGSSGATVLCFGPKAQRHVFPFHRVVHSKRRSLSGYNEGTLPMPDGPCNAEDLLKADSRTQVIEAVESQEKYNNCKKNEGHPTFLPTVDLTVEKLPLGFRSEQFFTWLRLTIDLTVRVRAKTGSSRPKDDDAYNCDPDISLVGTGFVEDVKQLNGPCSCFECQRGQPKLSWIIKVKSALHCLFNDEEANATMVDLFYETEESKITVKGLQFSNAYYPTDFCMFECVTHDEDLYHKIKDKLTKWHSLYDTLKKEDWSGTPDKAFIVSHPHGRLKKLTIGDLESLPDAGGQSYLYPWQVKYNTDTCPGSSGASVFIFGQEMSRSKWAFRRCHHSEGGELNMGYLFF